MIKFASAIDQSDTEKRRLTDRVKWATVSVALLGPLITNGAAIAGKADDTLNVGFRTGTRK